jgi:hypothetical protein
MSERERLSNRRVHAIFDFEAMGLRFTAGVGRYPDGRIGEIFLNHRMLHPQSVRWLAILRLFSALLFSTAPMLKQSAAPSPATARGNHWARLVRPSTSSSMMWGRHRHEMRPEHHRRVRRHCRYGRRPAAAALHR